jgi:PTH1 family peptidyl-tRNA hydrolase
MRLLVGLGNPGAEYAFNRHNIGFLAVDAIAERYRFTPWKARFQGVTAEGFINGMKVLALKPGTYMNLSGQSVGEAARFFKISPENVIVVYDEIELAPGKVKAKKGGGSAGHNGIKSIDAHIGADYWRVRLGVGRPDTKEKVTGHVLQNFSKADAAWLGPLLDAVGDAMPWMIAGNESKFLTRVAFLTKPPPEKKTQEKNTPEKKNTEPTGTD